MTRPDTSVPGPKIRRALVSVSDKRGVAPFAQALASMGVELVSTGGTAKALREAGLKVLDVAEVTGLAEMLGGRVKTLHPKVHGGILAKRGDASHEAALREHQITPIDLVCVNLYPFCETIAKEGVTRDEAVEQIDIGGPAMVRAAAKNHDSVTIVTDPASYDRVLADMREHDGATSTALRRRLAADAFDHTARYDRAIADYLASQEHAPGATLELRYGENPHQHASARTTGDDESSVAAAELLHGKPLSYNNLNDAAAALELAMALRRADASLASAVIVKHTNPCGVGCAASPAAAFDLALSGDPLAAYGGILACTAPIDSETASRIARDGNFFEVVCAPAFDPGAIERLSGRWKNVRLLALGGLKDPPSGAMQFRSIPGAVLEQERDLRVLTLADLTHAAGPAPDPAMLAMVPLLDQVVRALTSNAVCIGGRGEPDGVVLFGAGAGQMDRVTSCRLASEKAGSRARGAIACSDAFFPFPDGPKLLIAAGVSMIVHPGGSKRDEETFKVCDEAGVTCITTGVRRFRH